VSPLADATGTNYCRKDKEMAIKLVEGLHLTATNKRHLTTIIAQGWTSGESGQIKYSVTPIEGEPNRYRYCITKRERLDNARSHVRESRGILEYICPSVMRRERRDGAPCPA